VRHLLCVARIRAIDHLHLIVRQQLIARALPRESNHPKEVPAAKTHLSYVKATLVVPVHWLRQRRWHKLMVAIWRDALSRGCIALLMD
jgi:hypothetical protein